MNDKTGVTMPDFKTTQKPELLLLPCEHGSDRISLIALVGFFGNRSAATLDLINS